MAYLSSYHRNRLLLGGACILSFLLFGWASRIFQFPAHPGFEKSVFQQPSFILPLVVAALLLALCTAIGTFIAGSVRHNAGLFAAAVGLAAFSWRGGTLQDTLFWAASHDNLPRIFLLLALETLLLALLIAGCWILMHQLYLRRVFKQRDGDPVPAAIAAPRGNEIALLAVQAAVTLFGILLLAQTDARQQVLAAVLIASLAGPMVAHLIFPAAQTTWSWLPPLLVGILGYFLAYGDPAGANIGLLWGNWAPLARPLPLDYASAGPAGALLGHWLAQRRAAEPDSNE